MKTTFAICLVALLSTANADWDDIDVICPFTGPNDLSVYFPYPYDCSKFFQCVHQTPSLMECPPGLEFNAALSVCDWPASANCEPTPIPTEAPETTPELEITTQEPVVTTEEPEPEITTEEPEPEVTTEEPEPEITTEEPEPEITTEEPEPEITTEEPEPEITTEEPEPEITTEEPEPEITTEEPEPEITTEEPELEITTEEPEPEITTEEPEPEITTEEPEPEITTEEPQPEVTTEEAEDPTELPPIDAICVPGEFQLLPYPYDCTKFYMCNHGIPVLMDCAPGTEFSAATEQCDFPSVANCTPVSPP